MKILKLKIQNIASIEHAEIDFEKGVLANESLFLITGETGSGKSTLLNAITLALYNCAPNLEAHSSKDADPQGLAISSSRQLMRSGSVEASVELEFEGNDENRYISRWYVWRARKKVDGSLQNVLLTLECPARKLFLKGGTAVGAEIERVVGMSFQQFTRTTVLAQGQFTRFLFANSAEKAEILEKLTDTSIYSQIGKKVFERYSEKKKEYAILKETIAAVRAGMLPETEKAALRQSIDDLRQLAVRLEAEKKDLEQKISWLTEHAKLEARQADKKQKHEAASQALATDEALEHIAAIEAWDETVEIRGLIARLSAKVADINRLQSDFNALQGQYNSALAGAKWLESKCKDLQSDIAVADANIQAEAPNVKTYESAGQIEVYAKRIVESVDGVATQNTELEKLQKQEAKVKKALEQLAEDEAKAKRQFDEAKGAADACKAEADKYDIPALTRIISEASSLIISLNEAKTRCQAFDTATGDSEKAASRLAELKSEYDGHAAHLKELEDKLPNEKKALDAWTRQVEGQKRLIDHIADLRKAFHDSQTCPLCGSAVDHLHDDATLDATYNDAEEQRRMAEDVYNATDAGVRDAKANMRTLQSHIKTQETESKRKSNAAEMAKSLAVKALSAVCLTLEGDKINEATYHALDQRLAETEQKRSETEQVLGVANAKKTAYDKAIEVVDCKRNALADVQADVQAKTKDLDDIKAKQQTCNQLITRADEEAESALTALNALLPADMQCGRDQAKAVSNDIARRAKAYSAEVKRADGLRNTLDSSQSTLEQAERVLRALDDRFEHPAMVVPSEDKDLIDNVMQLSQTATELAGQIQNARNDQTDLQQRIDTYYIDQDKYTPERVTEISALPQADVERWRTDIADKRRAAQMAQGELRALDSQIAEHLETKPALAPEDTLDGMTARKDAAQAEIKDAEGKVASAITRLDEDDKSASRIADDEKKLAILQSEADDWEQLNKAFGQTDGSRFKIVAQCYVLRTLLHKANEYLRLLNPRYSLDCTDDSLHINVIDRAQGGAVRNVVSLSGGEQFLVSLALALGLSCLGGSALHVDTLFIDEGFGTLSQDVLDSVMTTLESLHQLGGRRVGVISHVASLRTRIPAQIQLHNAGPNSSRVVVALTQ